MYDLVSIIMPTYNSEKTITDSIESIITQTYTNWELIITDDYSSDSTVEIIKHYTTIDKRIKLFENNINKGPSNTRNISIENSTGHYIAFLDSDDIWLPKKLELQLIWLRNGWDIVCSNYFSFNNKTPSLNKLRISPEKITFSDMLKSNFIGNLTGIYNCEKLGKIYQKKSGHEDYIMWLDILKKSKKAYCIQEPLARYRISDDSLSGNKIKAIKWQWYIYRRELKLSIIKSSYYFSHYILNAFKKRR